MTACPLVIAHRGASAEAPENTMAAFARAWELGSDAIECDVRLTADGEVVCIHDADTSRVSGQRMQLEQNTYAALKALDVGAWLGPNYSGTQIPLLSQLLCNVPVGRQVFIEVKCGVEILPRLIIELQAAPLKLQQLTVIAFDTSVVQQLKCLLPELRVYWLHSVGSDYCGRSKIKLKDVLNQLRELGADGLGLSAHTGINQRIVTGITQAGLELNIWTVDDPQEAFRLAELGVNSITTNQPLRVRQICCD